MFAVNIVNLINVLPQNRSIYIIGNQLVRSGTSVGANIEEAQNSSSKKEFIHKMTIALKEARESEYWIKLIIKTINNQMEQLNSLLLEIREIIKILTTIIKNAKLNS